MSAPEPTAVERTIADRMAAATSTLPSGPLAQDDVLEWIDEHASQAVVAAIRAMTPEQQAELIGGDVERASFDRDGSFYRLAADAEDEKHLLTYGGTIKARVVSGWRLSEVQP